MENVVNKSFNNKSKKKILIIGHAGYVGTVLVDHLKKKYFKFGIDANWFNENVLQQNTKKDFQPHKSLSQDIRKININRLNFIPDAIIYLAAISNDPMGNKFAKITHEINTSFCLKVAKQAKKMGVSKFIFASSCSIYGSAGNSKKKENHKIQPLTDYAKSKVNSEIKLKKLSSNNFKVISLRFATAAGYSPKLRLDLVFNDSVANSITNKKILILSDGKPWRPLIHVKDMARSINWAIEFISLKNFIAINVGSDKWTFTIKKLANIVAKTMGGVKVEVNKNSQPDKRSYTVDFSLFKELCKKYQPKEDLEKSIKLLSKKMLGSKANFKDFRNSKKFIRLKTLIHLQREKKLDKNLYWKI